MKKGRWAISGIALIVACGGTGAGATTTEAPTTTVATTTTTVRELDLNQVLCGAVLSHSCEGDETYASLSLTDPGLIDKTLNTMVFTLGFPTSLHARVGNTRALDGTLTAESPDGYLASWTYHPDDGLSLVVEKN